MNIESCLVCALHNRQCHRLSFCTCQEIPYKCVEATNPPTHLTSQSYQSPITNLIKRQAGLHSAFFDIRYPLAVKDLWSGIQNPNTVFLFVDTFCAKKTRVKCLSKVKPSRATRNSEGLLQVCERVLKVWQQWKQRVSVALTRVIDELRNTPSRLPSANVS